LIIFGNPDELNSDLFMIPVPDNLGVCLPVNKRRIIDIQFNEIILFRYKTFM
jgi:hypothetical protein